MNWLQQIKDRVFRPGESVAQADRRAFLFGATVTAAGLLVPKPTIFLPQPLERFAVGGHALVIESLEATLKVVTFKMEHLYLVPTHLTYLPARYSLRYTVMSCNDAANVMERPSRAQRT